MPTIFGCYVRSELFEVKMYPMFKDEKLQYLNRRKKEMNGVVL